NARVGPTRQSLQTFFAGSDCFGSETFIAQNSAQRFANTALIIDYQDRFGHKTVVGDQWSVVGGQFSVENTHQHQFFITITGRRSLTTNWKLNDKPCAARIICLGIDSAVVLGNYASHDRQSQPSSPSAG